MKIELRKLSDIKPYEGNPRVNDQAVDAVAASIKEYGFRQPIVVDAAGVIVVGHTRWKAAQKLGLETVPVHVAEGLTPAQIKAYRLADNKLAELAEWNMELLPIELKDLQGMDVDLGLLGFGSEELEKLLGAGIHGNEGLTDPDAVPEPPDDAITQPGDLWILGNHRLLCGDSAKPEDVDRLLDGAKIQLVNTDPPYNVKVEPRSNNAIAAGLSSFPGDAAAQRRMLYKTMRGELGGQPGPVDAVAVSDARGMHHQGFDLARDKSKAQPTTRKLRPKDRPLENDFVSDEEFDRLLRAWFGNIARVLEPGRAAYIWGGYANCANYPAALKECGLYFSQAIIWVKEHPVLTRKDFMGNHEWCQPPDTKVLTPEGDVPISSLRNGDRVVSYSAHHAMILGRRRGYAVRRAERLYRGSLFGVVAGRKTTWATDGHLWSARMTPAARHYWCVYLMRRGTWWRVGKSKLYTTWGFGPKQRLMFEGGEEAWILSLHPSNVDAATAEQMVSVRYGIPTTYWRQSRLAVRPEAEIQRMYDTLDANALAASAYRALLDHDRRIEYPLLRRESSLEKVGARVPFLVRTCNLLPEVMAVPVPTLGAGLEWTPVDEIVRERFEGTVHSLDVEKNHHYVADGLVTHNCFYTWREGAAHYFNPEIHNATDVWSIKKVNPQSMVHLTEKPVELAVRAMTYSSQPGENVLDLFGGSGSTLIGAEKTGRRAFLMELDPLYSDVIVKRYEEFTGKKAERIPAEVTPSLPASEVGKAGFTSTEKTPAEAGVSAGGAAC